MSAVMHKNDVETRVKALERQVAILTRALNTEGRSGRLQLSSQQNQPPSLGFAHAREGQPPHLCGTVEAGDFGNGYQALRIRSSGQASLDLESPKDIRLMACNSLHLNAANVRIDAQRVRMDGELSARLSQTEAVSWQSGQLPVRLVHQSHGIPVLTELKGKFRNNSSGIKMYVDPEDGYWYLTGDSSKGADIFARVICIGRV